MNFRTNSRQIQIAVMAALGAAAMTVASSSAVAAKGEGQYLTGDFHNHSTCSDGQISMQKLVKKSMDKQDTPWGLDWFAQAGHGGSGNRNCTLAEDASLATPAFPLVFSTTGQLQGPGTTWQSTNPPVEIKGRTQGTAPNRVMWRWQSLQEVQYPLLEYLSGAQGKPLFLGLESVVAGHEHTSMAVITGQMPAGIEAARNQTTAGYKPLGNATALAQWSYCFDRGDTDTSRGNTTETSGIGNNWDCSIPGSPNSTSPALGWNDAARKLIPASGTGAGERGHAKTVEAVRWMAQFHGEQSYYVPAHLERAGPFNPNGNNGFNIEHLRNLNNAAPRVAFGMETQPGHGASGDRGEYRPARNNIGGVLTDSAGGTTWGGTGIYGAQVGGVWDALLGEGRNWWFFASSDWHNRGSFGPDDRRSTNDFYPGEYQRNYTLVVTNDATGRERRDPAVRPTPQQIVDGLRTGNGFADSGQLIDRLSFVACLGNPGAHGRSDQAVETLAIDAALDNESPVMKGCATMGQKLTVPAGRDVVVSIVVRDPTGTSYSPYTFNNPSLAQIGIEQPLNRPVLDHVDVIRGLVTGYRQPGSPDYSGAWPSTWLVNPDLATVPAAAKNPSAAVIKTYNSATWRTVPRAPEFKAMTFRLSALQASQYLRLRGTNLPAGVPYETDANGNPLSDIFTNMIQDRDPSRLAIKCTVTGKNVPANEVTYTGTAIDGCPEHLPVKDGQKYVAFDVAAWADLWFYSNPIYLQVDGSTLVAGVQ